MSAWREFELEELEALREEEEGFLDPLLRLVCRCRGVEEAELEALVRAAAGRQGIVERTGGTTGCGGCRNVFRCSARAASWTSLGGAAARRYRRPRRAPRWWNW